jgi:hypothetical protein
MVSLLPVLLSQSGLGNIPLLSVVSINMRGLLIILMLMCLAGCGPGLQFNASPEMTPAEMLERASMVFVGVIEKQQLDSWPMFRLNAPGVDPESAHFWKILRRSVRVETVLKGSYVAPRIQVFEIFWTGGATGHWNSTFDGERALFLVRLENGRYHIVRDWWHSIFRVTTGRHTRMPLGDSAPFWERLALMNFRIEQIDPAVRVLQFRDNDPADALGEWRRVKLLRGFVRHPNAAIRVSACRDLLLLSGWGQDECWDQLSREDRSYLSDGGYIGFSEDGLLAMRRYQEQRGAQYWWSSHDDPELRRIFTAFNSAILRPQFCALWLREYPEDHDNGCPADQPPPATISTLAGDVPLTGPWPDAVR